MYTVYCAGLRGWSRLALAEDTFWFSLSFSGDWIHVQANRGSRFFEIELKLKTLFIHGILSLQSGILKSRALYNILIRSTNYALI